MLVSDEEAAKISRALVATAHNVCELRIIEDLLNTREAVIATGEEEKSLAEASKGKCRGDSVFRAGYIAGIDFMLDSIHDPYNPKEAAEEKEVK
ncbi:hypothetical protein ES703_09182 [subsurface metagenome]